jgi:hypothetical protein
MRCLWGRLQVGAGLPSAELPFDLSQHPLARTHTGAGMLARLRADAQSFAADARKSRVPELLGLGALDAKALAR